MMSERKQFLYSLLIVAAGSIVITAVTTTILYRAALQEQRDRLVETVHSQARLITAVFQFASTYYLSYPEGAEAATWFQVRKAYQNFKGFGRTGEFTFANRRDDDIHFLMELRHDPNHVMRVIPIESKLDEPMRRALAGESGSIIALDYRSELVLAAYEPLKDLQAGIVAKIDMKEIRRPYQTAGMVALGSAALIVSGIFLLFLRISNPIIQELQQARDELEKRVAERTAQLLASNEQLKDRIAAQQTAEAALIESEANLRRLSQKILDAHEEEQKRIGQELHDGLAQSLSAIKIWVENALVHLERRNMVQASKSLRSIVPMAQAAVEDVRRISKNLRPTILDDLGILATISWLCNDFSGLYPAIMINRQIAVTEDQIAEPLKLVIFRVLQEALNNIAKHSQARQVEISLSRSGERLILVVSDDGIGFDRSQDHAGAGLGLASMQERVNSSDGTFDIQTSRASGTTITAAWNLAA